MDNQHSYVPSTLAVRLTAAVSGRPLIVCADRTGDEDRVADGLSNGTNGADRVEIAIGGTCYWVERRDLCDDDGEPIAWTPYDLPATGTESVVGADLPAETDNWTPPQCCPVCRGFGGLCNCEIDE